MQRRKAWAADTDVEVKNPVKSPMEQMINHRYYRWIERQKGPDNALFP